jgi:hypothetical protein
MRTLMSGEAWVHYGQIYLQSDSPQPDLYDSWAGQANGLAGAAAPGFLFLITGLHTGEVGFTVELHDQEPPLGDQWEEAVEVSYRPDGEAALVAWASEVSWPLELEQRDYRARYCATGMEQGRALDTRMEEVPLADHYLLQLWPSPPAPDRILRQTSDIAAYWHGCAAQQPPAHA